MRCRTLYECADRNTFDTDRENVNQNIATGPRPVHFFTEKTQFLNRKEDLYENQTSPNHRNPRTRTIP